MAGPKVKLKDQLGRVVRLGGDSTGATVGKDLRWPDGSLVKSTEIRNPAADAGGTGPAATVWRLIREVPANLQRLARLAGVGFATRGADGEWHQRTIEAGEGIEVTNGDGVAGDPVVGLAELPNAGGGELVRIARDGYGRVAGTSSAEAPQDGRQYARKDGSWVEATGGGVPEAPEDGKLYGRKDAYWVEVPAGGGGGSVWHNGTTAPPPSLGADGDQYLDTDTSDVYAKEAGAWVFKVNIKGAQGPQGIPGPRGGGIVTTALSLLHFDGAAGSTTITDAAAANPWSNYGGAQLSAVRSKFGSTSLRLSNASARQFLELPYTPALNYQLDFTVEAWVWRESATRNTIFARSPGGPSPGAWYVAAMPDGVLRVVFDTGAFQVFDSAPAAVPVGAWAHVAMSKQGSMVRGFVDGIPVCTGTLVAQPGDSGQPLRVGTESSFAVSRDFLGWMDDFRYSTAALYTAAFAPPTTAFGLPVSPQFPAYTMASLPPAAGNEFCPIYVTDLTGGGEPCVSDGFVWRRMSDRSVAS